MYIYIEFRFGWYCYCCYCCCRMLDEMLFYDLKVYIQTLSMRNICTYNIYVHAIKCFTMVILYTQKSSFFYSPTWFLHWYNSRIFINTSTQHQIHFIIMRFYFFISNGHISKATIWVLLSFKAYKNVSMIDVIYKLKNRSTVRTKIAVK